MSRNYAMTSLDEYKIFKNTRHGCVWWRLSRPHVKLFTIRIVTNYAQSALLCVIIMKTD